MNARSKLQSAFLLISVVVLALVFQGFTVAADPVADPGGPYGGRAGQPIVFDGSGSFDPDSVIVEYRWNFGPGRDDRGPLPFAVHTFDRGGEYDVELRVRDDSDGEGRATTRVTVQGEGDGGGGDDDPPDVSIVEPGGDVTITAGESVTFEADVQDGGDNLTLTWDFPGGTPSSSSDEDPGDVRWDAPGTYTVTFTATNDEGSHSDQVVVTVDPPNQAPTASIDDPSGNVTISEGQSVTFAGSGSDPDGSIASFSWSFPGGSPSSSDEEDPGSVTYSTAGTFTATLTVTDDGGATDVDSRQITVQPAPNQPPNATMDSPGGSVVIQAGQSVSFEGTGTDSDGTIVSYSWSFPGGSPTSSAAEDPGSVTFPNSGVFVVTFNVTDDDGASDPSPPSRTITVTPATGTNQPPNAAIDSPSGNVTIQAGQSVSFAGTGTDSDGTIVSYSWSFPGGSPASSTAEDPGSVTFPNSGVFVVTFNVTDDDGASDPSPASRTITVTPAGGTNQPPNAAIDSPSGNVTIQAGQSVSFAGTGTDTDGTIVAHSWSFPGGAPATSAAEDPGVVTFASTGVFVVTYNVTDDDGASDPSPARRTITVTPASGNNQPPNATIDQPSGNVTIQAGRTVTFAGSGTDPDGTVTGFSWSFPGGSPSSSTQQNPGNVVFATPGVYTVTFNVTDDDGAGDPSPATRTITVTSAPGQNQAPNTEITQPTGNVTIQAGQTVTFAGEARDPDGQIAAYDWNFGGGVGNGSVEDPGPVSFPNPGVYTVTFNARDDQGVSDPTPARRTVTVTQLSPSNQAPSATIDEPPSGVTIQAGQSVTFRGTGRDPDGAIVAHLWTFGGGAANQNVEDPGAVTFATPGTYTVTYNVTDSGGASDPTPPSVTVTVQGSGGGGGNVADFNVEAGMPGSADRVDGHDVMFVLRAVLTQDPRADVNGDGVVDEVDVQLTLAALGRVE